MTITAATDAINLTSAKEMTHFTKAVTGGTLHIVSVRDDSGPEGVAVTFTPTAVGTIPPKALHLSEASDAAGTPVVSTSPASGAFTITCTPGTSNILAGHSVQNTNLTDTAIWEYQLPDTYVAGANIAVTAYANYTGTGTAGTCTLAAAAYLVAAAGTHGSTLIATAAQAVTGTNGAKSFVVTGTTLVPGDVLMFRFQLLITETGNVNPLIGRMTKVLIG